MAKRCLWHGIVLILLTLVFPTTSFAGEATKEIKETTDKIIAIISDPAFKGTNKRSERDRLLRKVVDERFDWREMSRRTLARHWKKRSDKEKRLFVDLFGKLLERTYMDRVGGYSGEKVLYQGEKVDGKYGIVKVKIITKKETEIPVKYRVKKKKGEWFIYDISVQGISLINNYRKQFNSIIIKSSFNDLMKKLKAKVSGD
ncbi:MAG: ABC transporter substrate-binding protein [Desulfobacteraceae bacterium]|nr:ABC transporter substrate-binding protein [Desulfobacteraceae bacterium]